MVPIWFFDHGTNPIQDTQTKGKAMTSEDESASIKSALRKKGYNLAELERMCSQGGLATDEALMVPYFRLLSDHVLLTPVAEVQIAQGFNGRRALESIFNQITGERRSFSKDPYPEFGRATEGKVFNLIIVVDKGIGFNPVDPEVRLFANAVRSMISHREVKVVAFCEDRLGIPLEMGRNLMHLKAKK